MVFKEMRDLFSEYRSMPRIAVNLMLGAAADNDPFYGRLVQKTYTEFRRRHPRYPFLRRCVRGVALCPLPATFDDYFMVIDGSARRNFKKAVREGAEIKRIEFNEELEGIRAVRMSADVRQGRPVPEEYRAGTVSACCDPPSRSAIHAYPYFGVFLKGRLIGYAGCLVCGEVCCVEQILGHADFLSLGAVPQLIIGVAKHLYAEHPQVRHYMYGTYFGGGETLRRFKRKFGFVPHHVDWQLGQNVGNTLKLTQDGSKAGGA